MAIPTEAVERGFTPPSLRNLPSPPVFHLRYGTRRDRDRFGELLVEEGLRHNSSDVIRNVTEAGLRALWDEEQFNTHIGRIKAYWEAVDQHGKALAAAQPNQEVPFVFDATEAAAIQKLLSDVSDNWPPLRRLAAQNLTYSRHAPVAMLCIVLTGWDGISVPYGRSAGIVTLDKLEELGEALEKIETEHAGRIEGIGDVGTALLQLSAEAGKRLFLSKEEEKNSPSPAPSSVTQEPMSTGKASEPGPSKEQAISEPTPAT